MDKQVIEVIILKEEVIHSIQSNIHRFERTRGLQTPVLLDNEADRYNLCQLIDAALTEAVEAMQAYLMLPSPFAHRIANNHTDDWKEKGIRLAMPLNWPAHLLEPLKNAIHKFLARKTESELLSESYPNDPFTVRCEALAETHYNEINSIISDRIGPIHIHPSPFG